MAAQLYSPPKPGYSRANYSGMSICVGRLTGSEQCTYSAAAAVAVGQSWTAVTL